MTFSVVLLFVAVAGTIACRAAFVRASARSAVDHYYWLLAARAYRQAHRLPAVIKDKYLLEDERQAYPPFMGWLLARIPESILIRPSIVVLVQIADAITLVMLIVFAAARGSPLDAMTTIVVVFGMAPALVAYNTQLASRAFGNMFLVAAILVAAAAAGRPEIDGPALALYAAAVLATSAVVLSHKMSVQLMLALWPLWAIVSGRWLLVAVPLLGITLAVLVTGAEFARLQWRAHRQIVAFWHRHRDDLGAHPFNASPIYGDPARRSETTFHRPGWRGALRHAILAFGYGPLIWLAPLTLLWDVWPPGWIVVWSTGAAMVALLTLYVPWLRCLGAGHLYVFNAIAPAALWWGDIVGHGNRASVALLALGLLATAASLVLGYRKRAGLGSKRDESFQSAVERLSALPQGRVAVFPMVAAEEVAYRTRHAVLWGAHSLGFERLEPVFPVVKQPIGQILGAYDCNLLLFDTAFWPGGAAVVERELPGSGTLAFGSWRLVSLPRRSSGSVSTVAAEALPAMT